MATHSSILAWKIPWTEEPGGLSLWGHKESGMTEHRVISINLLSLLLRRFSYSVYIMCVHAHIHTVTQIPTHEYTHP